MTLRASSARQRVHVNDTAKRAQPLERAQLVTLPPGFLIPGPQFPLLSQSSLFKFSKVSKHSRTALTEVELKTKLLIERSSLL